MSRIPELLSALRGAGDFESVAVATLNHLLSIADAAVHAGDWPRARLLRAMVHLRENGGYVGAWSLEPGGDRLQPPGHGEELLPSATAWRRVAQTLRPAMVDVVLRTVTGADGKTAAVRWADRRPEPLPEASQVRLSAREATHVAALPLYGPGGLRGLLSIEARCRAAIGTPFIWPGCVDAMEVAAAVAGPWLVGQLGRPGAHKDGPSPDPGLPVIGPTMQPIVQLAEAFAAEDETLLIRGETGTGKSRLARWSHGRSSRHTGPFVVLDLLGVPSETQVGELFGWRKGAFTGAVKDHDGAVSRAEGGTLFIDEIDKLSLDAQAALLRLLEERVYRPLGADGDERQADVRFMVGTNLDLGTAVAEGRFREDLLYRIDVLPVALPPLRSRSDEVADWARFMLRRMSVDRGRPTPELTDDAARWLAGRPWPGNLRELDNTLRRATAMARIERTDLVDVRHLLRATHLSAGRSAAPAGRSIDDGLTALLLAIEGREADVSGVDWPGALHGLLLARATQHAGGREAAFELLGRGDVVRNRNHHRTLKREWAKALALLDALGTAPDDRDPPE